ncbi:MAG TPA: hypothetical protein VN428_23385, partial [Bryobacteraceae bacterium]|nr:hypothetical protein [Bryobacteraceae bacterium]
MTSPAQITANRVNARLSTGPRTVEGKARSSRNRLTHGLCGAHTVLPGEDPADYEYLLEALLEEHNPAGPTETLLIAQLAQAQWKLNRIAVIEADLFAKQFLPNEPDRNPDGDMAVPVPSGNAPLQYEPNLADAFQKATASLAALARHEAAARRAFD